MGISLKIIATIFLVCLCVGLCTYRNCEQINPETIPTEVKKAAKSFFESNRRYGLIHDIDKQVTVDMSSIKRDKVSEDTYATFVDFNFQTACGSIITLIAIIPDCSRTEMSFLSDAEPCNG